MENHSRLPLATASVSWSIDLHYPDSVNQSQFPTGAFISYCRQSKIHPYPVPYRCFYSRNIDNLFMVGRNISVTHIALGTTRLMRTIGMFGEVVGMATFICKKHNTEPRGVYKNYLDELKMLMQRGVGKYGTNDYPKYNLGEMLEDEK